MQEIRENSLGDEGVKVLVPVMRKSTSLVHVDLTSNQITNQGAALLFDALRVNQSIFCFFMRNTPGPYRNVIKPGGFVRIAPMLKQNKTLGILDVSGNSAGNVGLTHIAAGLYKNFTLISLNISQTYIDQGSVEGVIQILKYSKVKYLDISKNKLDNPVSAL